MSWEITGNANTNELVNFLGTTDQHALVIRTNGQDRMTVDVNGNVGIGTNTPNSKLEIIGQDGLQIVGFQPFLTLNDSNNQEFALCRMQGANGDIFFHTFSTITLKQDAAMVIKTGSGNVGIGTPTPSSRLHVAGDVQVKGDITATGNLHATGNLNAFDVLLAGGDCAEDFSAVLEEHLEAGSVVIASDADGALRLCETPYRQARCGCCLWCWRLSPGNCAGPPGVARRSGYGRFSG